MFIRRFNHNAKPHIAHDRPRRKLEDMSHGELERLLDAEVSFYIRATYAMKHPEWHGLYCECFTCSAVKEWKKMDAGHFIRRDCRGTRWDIRDIRPQCTECNDWKHGCERQFEEHLRAEIGDKDVDDLLRIEAMWGKTRMPREWILAEIKRYRKDVNPPIREKLRRMM